MHMFTWVDGSNPRGYITIAPEGRLYGTAQQGGTWNVFLRWWLRRRLRDRAIGNLLLAIGFAITGVTSRGFQGTVLAMLNRLVMRPGVEWEQARSPVVWLAV